MVNPNATTTSSDFNQTRSSSSGLVLTLTSRNYGTGPWGSLTASNWKDRRLAACQPLQMLSAIRSALSNHRRPRTPVAKHLRHRCPCVRDPFRRRGRLSSGQRFACAQHLGILIVARPTPQGRAPAPNSCGSHGAPSRARPCL